MKQILGSVVCLAILCVSRAVGLEEDFSIFPNPERGFYSYRNLASPGDLSELRAQNITLMWGRILLTDYRETAKLPKDYLDALQAGFDAAQESGLKVIIRGSYGHIGPGGDYTTYQDPDGDILKGHIEQLAPLFKRNVHLIAFFEAGFLGPWGEWHSTRITTTPELQREYFFHILDHTPKSRMVALRYPELKRSIFQRRRPFSASRAYDGSRISRTGHHNDCFLSSFNDVGTYNRGGSNRQEETAYLAEETLHTLFGGETCRVHVLNDADRALSELELLHASYLNDSYHPGVLKKWKDQQCYDEISRRLGARFVARSLGILPHEVRVEIENVGFASLYNERPVRLVIVSDVGQQESVPLECDPRRWKPGETITIRHRIPTARIAHIGLHLPDPARLLEDNPAYAYRLANEGAWDATTGINWLTDRP